MGSEDFQNRPISIASFHDLVSHELELVRRINAVPVGGHLFLIDPLRFLESVGVTVSSSALAEWRKHIGSPLFGNSSNGNSYVAISNAKSDRKIRFTFRALLKETSR